MRTARFIPALALLAGAPALAQTSNVLPTEKFAWGENVGFLNTRDAGSPSASQGMVVAHSILMGYIWGENIGWISLGDGAPANAFQYANAVVGPGLDWGVNKDPSTGNLSGYAWAENVGWINFGGGAMATPAQPARFNKLTHRFEGYAWGENIGWINLNSIDVPNGKSLKALFGCNPADIATGGDPDFDAGPDGFITGEDFDLFIATYFKEYRNSITGHLVADCSTSGGGGPFPDGFVTGEDFDQFVFFYFTGC